jgi:hypothetical protein
LAKANPERQLTSSASVPLVGGMALLTAAMSKTLDKRVAFRLPIVVAGAMLASGRAQDGGQLVPLCGCQGRLGSIL